VASGLAALLDDVAVIAKLAAASLDDVGAAAGKAGAKAAGVVIDDTAVTPRYVTGFTPDRELPVIAKIATGSLRNKLLFLLPAALLLSSVAPAAITPLLMLGGAYLSYESAEKLLEAVRPHEHALDEEVAELSSADHEAKMVAGAVRTDFILSAEIMAIAVAEVAQEPLATRAAVLVVVAFAITVGVYGAVGLLVKMDDVGLRLAQLPSRAARLVGRGLVLGMPKVLALLSAVGIAAMAWVGGGILLHGLHEFHLTPLPGWVEAAGAAAAGAVPAAHGLVEWLVEASCSGVFGVLVGAVIVAVHHAWTHRPRAATPGAEGS
jgi:predicted DNA repair protein MutK